MAASDDSTARVHLPRFSSGLVPRFEEDLELATFRFADSIGLRAIAIVDNALEGVDPADKAIGKRLVHGARWWLTALRHGDEPAVTEALDAVRNAYRSLLADTRVSETMQGRTLAAAAAKLVAALSTADRARCMAAVVAREGP